MADTFGLLELPAPVPDAGETVTDPALSMLLEFCKAVLNDEVGDAWAAVAKTDPTLVKYTFDHNPQAEEFYVDKTPALYMWRSDENGTKERYSQDLVSDEGGFTALWVPPYRPQDKMTLQEPIRNGIKKSLRAALAQGRHPAWVLVGDTYYQPEDYGSVLLYHTKIAKVRLGAFRNHRLIIESIDKSTKTPFDCLLFTIEATEFAVKDAALQGPALDHIQGTVKLPGRGENFPDTALSVLPFHLEMELTGIDPTTGDPAGGETLDISGKQFEDVDYEVTFGTTLISGDDVEFVDESTLRITTPPQGAMPDTVSITVRSASGVEKTLTDAFTYA